MKKLNFFSKLFLALCLTGLTGNLFADADACRKNKCRNGKRYKQTAKVKGGTSNCGNSTVGTAWHCTDNFSTVSSVSKWRGSTPCSCGSVKLAVEAHALSNQTTLYTYTGVYETGCGWPNKWKAGTSSFYQSVTTPAAIKLSGNGSEEYRSQALVKASESTWNYDETSVSLTGLSANLLKYTGDMANDYATFVIDVTKVVGLDADGGEITESLYQCKVTIYESDLLVEDPTGAITANHFTRIPVGNGGVSYVLDPTDITLPLSSAISDEDELNLNFAVDCGNYEDGPSARFIVDPSLTSAVNEKISASQALSLKVMNNPVMMNEVEFSASVKAETPQTYRFFMRDITGKIVKEWSMPLSGKEEKYSISTEGLKNGVYMLSVQYNGEEYGRKIILDKGN